MLSELCTIIKQRYILEHIPDYNQGNDFILFPYGASVTFIPELEKDDHDAHPLYESVKPVIEGACKFCSKSFGVINDVRKTDVNLIEDYDGHPSLRTYIADGYQIVTF